jgi:hypothetical protein
VESHREAVVAWLNTVRSILQKLTSDAYDLADAASGEKHPLAKLDLVSEVRELLHSLGNTDDIAATALSNIAPKCECPYPLPSPFPT